MLVQLPHRRQSRLFSSNQLGTYTRRFQHGCVIPRFEQGRGAEGTERSPGPVQLYRWVGLQHAANCVSTSPVAHFSPWYSWCRYNASKDDLIVYTQIQKAPESSQYPHASRWYNHIKGLQERSSTTALLIALTIFALKPPSLA